MAEIVDISYALKTRSYRARLRLDRGARAALHPSPVQSAVANAPRSSALLCGQYRKADETVLCESCPQIIREGKHGWFWWDDSARSHVHCPQCWLDGRAE